MPVRLVAIAPQSPSATRVTERYQSLTWTDRVRPNDRIGSQVGYALFTALAAVTIEVKNTGSPG